MIDKDIQKLNLNPLAEAGAQSLRFRWGALIKFNSGRRTPEDQAFSMAKNTVNLGRDWIYKTYKDSPAKNALISWLNGNPTIKDLVGIQAGFEKVFAGLPEDQLYDLSYHLSGDAFDIQPLYGPNATIVKKAIEMLPGLNKVLYKEGGKDIWHAQFSRESVRR